MNSEAHSRSAQPSTQDITDALLTAICHPGWCLDREPADEPRERWQARAAYTVVAPVIEQLRADVTTDRGVNPMPSHNSKATFGWRRAVGRVAGVMAAVCAAAAAALVVAIATDGPRPAPARLGPYPAPVSAPAEPCRVPVDAMDGWHRDG